MARRLLRFPFRLPLRQASAWLLGAIVLCPGAHAETYANYTARFDQVALGMPEAKVIALLDKPSQSAMAPEIAPDAHYDYFRAWHPVDGDHGSAGTTGFTPIRLRCLFRNGLLVKTSGYWGRQPAPPRGTPKNKVLLLDSASVYDGIAKTALMNRRLDLEKTRLTQELAAMQAELAKLNDEAKQRTRALRRFNGSADERAREKQAVATLQEQIRTKQEDIGRFTAENRARLVEVIERYRDLMLPYLDQAIDVYRQDHGYDYVFELDKNLFAVGVKPLLVSGVDETRDFIAWFNQLDNQVAAGTGK